VPGGRVAFGETLAEAVVREVAEETGLAVAVRDFLGWVERMGDDPAPHHFVILDFAVDVVDPDTEPRAGTDATEAAWVPRERLTGLRLVDGLLDFLEDVGALS
jgi:8-oxo-dGTP diphosphatase